MPGAGTLTYLKLSRASFGKLKEENMALYISNNEMGDKFQELNCQISKGCIHYADGYCPVLNVIWDIHSDFVPKDITELVMYGLTDEKEFKCKMYNSGN